jgi:F420-0:gamma-glutamyl ligase-like protein
MAQSKYPAKPVFTPVPTNWKDLTPEEKKAVTDEMAKEIQRRLGVKPKG